MPFEATSILKIAYEAGGPSDGLPVVLLHGWPDDVRTYDRVMPALHAAGFRTVAPFLRGFGDTSFISKDTMRSGEIVAMAQDIMDLADALKLQKFAVIGRDWGARIAYALAIAVPQRISRIVTVSVGWQPGELPTPRLKQAQAYWYQWFDSCQQMAHGPPYQEFLPREIAFVLIAAPANDSDVGEVVVAAA
jgi:pimeloyl-ACP methyl ester carboxylesterase